MSEWGIGEAFLQHPPPSDGGIFGGRRRRRKSRLFLIESSLTVSFAHLLRFFLIFHHFLLYVQLTRSLITLFNQVTSPPVNEQDTAPLAAEPAVQASQPDAGDEEPSPKKAKVEVRLQVDGLPIN